MDRQIGRDRDEDEDEEEDGTDDEMPALIDADDENPGGEGGTEDEGVQRQAWNHARVEDE